MGPGMVLGKVAFTAYGEALNWKNVQGLAIPKWEDLGEDVQNGWCEAARAAAYAFYKGKEDLRAEPGRNDRQEDGRLTGPDAPRRLG